MENFNTFDGVIQHLIGYNILYQHQYRLLNLYRNILSTITFLNHDNNNKTYIEFHINQINALKIFKIDSFISNYILQSKCFTHFLKDIPKNKILLTQEQQQNIILLDNQFYEIVNDCNVILNEIKPKFLNNENIDDLIFNLRIISHKSISILPEKIKHKLLQPDI